VLFIGKPGGPLPGVVAEDRTYVLARWGEGGLLRDVLPQTQTKAGLKGDGLAAFPRPGGIQDFHRVVSNLYALCCRLGKMTGFRPWPVSSAQVRHWLNRMLKYNGKRWEINAKAQECKDARVCAQRLGCVQLAGAVVRREAVRKREQAPRTPNASRGSVGELPRRGLNEVALHRLAYSRWEDGNLTEPFFDRPLFLPLICLPPICLGDQFHTG
jgi:hypothetical protein